MALRLLVLVGWLVLVGGKSTVPSTVLIRTDCTTEPIWIGNMGHADSFMCPQMHKMDHLSPPVVFTGPEKGLASNKFWALAGCDDATGLCTYGQSEWGKAGFIMPEPEFRGEGSMPSINSGFEVTFGCTKANPEECAANPSGKAGERLNNTDSFDVTAVDGLTIPLSLKVTGTCPMARNITTAGIDFGKVKDFEWIMRDGTRHTLDLRVVDARGVILGVAGPCKRLTEPSQNRFLDHSVTKAIPGFPRDGYPADHPDVAFYCCAGREANDSDACINGFTLPNGVRVRPFMNPGRMPYYTTIANEYIYSNPYGDNENLFQPIPLFECEAGMQYEVTFHCPIKAVDPAVTQAPAAAWVGVQWAKLRGLDTSFQCGWNTKWVGAEIQRCGNTGDSCQDCSALADSSVDVDSTGTWHCVCPPLTPIHAPPLPPGATPKWLEPSACPVHPPMAPVMLFYHHEESGRCYNDGLHRDGQALYEDRASCCNTHSGSSDFHKCVTPAEVKYYPSGGTCVKDAKHSVGLHPSKLHEPTPRGRRMCCLFHFPFHYSACMSDEEAVYLPALFEGTCRRFLKTELRRWSMMFASESLQSCCKWSFPLSSQSCVRKGQTD